MDHIVANNTCYSTEGLVDIFREALDLFLSIEHKKQIPKQGAIVTVDYLDRPKSAFGKAPYVWSSLKAHRLIKNVNLLIVRPSHYLSHLELAMASIAGQSQEAPFQVKKAVFTHVLEIVGRRIRGHTGGTDFMLQVSQIDIGALPLRFKVREKNGN